LAPARRPTLERLATNLGEQPPRDRPVGLWDTPLVWVAPRRLFERVEDVPTYAWALVVLLLTVTGLGYASVQTGLIDREIDRGVAERIALIDQTQRDVVERSALRDLYEQQRKQGEFEKTLARINAVVTRPLAMLAGTLVVAAVLYGVVALQGRKAEWHTLMNICVFAGYTELLRQAATLALMMRFRTLEIDTSLAPLAAAAVERWVLSAQAAAALAGALTAFDPFRIWYWTVVSIGLRATSQMTGWRVMAVCTTCWLVGAAARSGLAYAMNGAEPA
jgi:hypothetical protein